MCTKFGVLIAQVVFLLEHGHTHIQSLTDATYHPTHESNNNTTISGAITNDCANEYGANDTI